ncbi:hypothetical protein STEG23_001614 [Scotinomys teguina]
MATMMAAVMPKSLLCLKRVMELGTSTEESKTALVADPNIPGTYQGFYSLYMPDTDVPFHPSPRYPTAFPSSPPSHPSSEKSTDKHIFAGSGILRTQTLFYEIFYFSLKFHFLSDGKAIGQQQVLRYFLTAPTLNLDWLWQDCSLKIREPEVPAPWFLDPGGWSKTTAVDLYFIFPGICTLSLDCSLKIREPEVPAPWFLDPGGWSKTAAVSLYFIFPGICTLSLISPSIYTLCLTVIPILSPASLMAIQLFIRSSVEFYSYVLTSNKNKHDLKIECKSLS